MDRSSRNRLTDRQRDRFPGEPLFDRIARAVCHADYRQRKELFEAWEVARRPGHRPGLRSRPARQSPAAAR